MRSLGRTHATRKGASPERDRDFMSTPGQDLLKRAEFFTQAILKVLPKAG
jgi:hypothetical protein